MKSRSVKTLIAVAVAASTLAACGKDDDNNPNPGNPPAPKPIVQIANDATFGKIMTDSTGKSLYFFSSDADGKNNCAGACATAWPYFYAGDVTKITLGDTSLHKEDFATISVTQDGKTFNQTTYKGWPLYYFAQDAKAGDVKGDKVGNIWFVGKPDYTVMIGFKQLVGNDGKNYDSKYDPNGPAGPTRFITDDRGRTLYAFTPDKFKTNTYTKPDFSNNATWPIFELTGIKNVPSVLAKSDFDIITGIAGTHTQVIYKNRPLYYFGPDQFTRGNTKGVSVPTPGVWPIVNESTVALVQ